ncbi:Dam family site-specific DNA-(adenine-N6)-methyltransferase [Mycoplasma marinum]|uniref:Site-specific DNA-methyltransferase (adenine-specific) n=1 Tax=Mycoplasma marinum TaxID=1937190 RepID=A0A4R0XL12_9MOLU|nr:Dam family site-specific DNA-(adenine-N6)-methyltransferase [Mycoplasma marinum]TCG11333.1 DNA methyltransferase [Mycoplasma marinum]
MVPFIKWAGGKRQLLPELRKLMPKREDIGTYYEPFIGGGALLFDFQPNKAVINDMNKELIHAYRMLDNHDKYFRLLELLILMETAHDEAFFKNVRRMDKITEETGRGMIFNDFSEQLRAARFIYLNKAGFNGIYRVNSSGYYNVPSGKKKKVKTYEYPNIEEISNYLSRKENKKRMVKIRNTDFVKAVHGIKPGDFVYFDPPYDYEEGINGFDAYQKGGFGRKGQIRLANLCRKLDKMGVKFMLSNHNTKFIQELFEGFDIKIVKARRSINSNGKGRGEVEEVIVRNYV